MTTAASRGRNDAPYRPGRCRHQPDERRKPADLGPRRSLPRTGQSGRRGRLRQGRTGGARLRRRAPGQAGGDAGRGARRGDRRVRAHRGGAGPADVLCPVAVLGRFHQRGDRPLLPDRERAGDHDQQPSAVLRARAEPAGRGGAGAEARRSGAGAVANPGCAICACSGRTSSPTTSRSCCTRRR